MQSTPISTRTTIKRKNRTIERSMMALYLYVEAASENFSEVICCRISESHVPVAKAIKNEWMMDMRGI